MKKHKENLFAEKFHLLNSQESQDITWSSSDSSDFENKLNVEVDKLCNITNKKRRKRKRKQTVPKNMSNLNITIVDVLEDAKNSSKKVETEITSLETAVECSIPKSPILGSNQYFSPYKCKNIDTSPILTSKSFENQNRVVLSPVLVLKTASYKANPNVRKKLFKSEKILNRKEIADTSKRKVNDTHCLDHRKVIDKVFHSQNTVKSKEQQKKIILEPYEGPNTSEVCNKITSIKNELATQISKVLENNDDIEILETQESNHVIYETPEIVNNSLSMLKTSSTDLANKVKSYFNCNFSSGNPSQNTISEISTPKNNSKSSDEIEIISSLTQVVSNKNSTESIKEVDLNKKEKKINYKKGGLAYRLNSLVKKQTANISLWNHEKFLAANSNFYIPKGDFLTFRICKMHYNYGCHLLEAIDGHFDSYLILINNCIMSTDIISKDIFVYKPYKVIDLNHSCKYVINVVKFECF